MVLTDTSADRKLRVDLLVAALTFAFTAVPTRLQLPNHAALLDALSFKLYPVDVVVNVLGYIPLGLALANRGAVRALVLAGGLSLCAEVMQLFSVGRTAEVVDFATNVLGAGLGLILATKWRRLPERVAVTRRGGAVAAAAAIAYVASGARFTVEPILDQISFWLDAPPWIATNPRGLASDGVLEAHWSFEALEHGVVGDVSGNGLQGVAVNAATLSPGAVGRALLLNGEQWVDFGTPASLRLTGSMTLSAWIKPLGFPADDAAIISSLSKEGLGYQLDLTVDQGPRTVGFKIADANGQLMARYGETPLVAGRWYHVAGVYDANLRTMDVYLDGARDNGCLIGTVTDRQRASGRHVFVGRRAGLDGFEFIGAIDEAEIQSRSRSPAEIAEEADAARRSVDLSAKTEISAGNRTVVYKPCVSEAAPPRVAGPLVALGMLIALICAGLWRGPRFDRVTLALCALTGGSAGFWMSNVDALERVWLPGLYILLGGVVVLLAARERRSHPLP